jgi:hypothetical protein
MTIILRLLDLCFLSGISSDSIDFIFSKIYLRAQMREVADRSGIDFKIAYRILMLIMIRRLSSGVLIRISIGYEC